MKKAVYILIAIVLCESTALALLLRNYFRFSPTATNFVMFDRKTGQSCWSGLATENPISKDNLKFLYDALDNELTKGKTQDEAQRIVMNLRKDFVLPLCKDLIR